MFDCLRLLFAEGVEEIGVGFQQWSVAGSEAREGGRVRSVGSGHAVLGPGEPPTENTSAVRGFVGGGAISVLRMRDLADA